MTEKDALTLARKAWGTTCRISTVDQTRSGVTSTPERRFQLWHTLKGYPYVAGRGPTWKDACKAAGLL